MRPGLKLIGYYLRANGYPNFHIRANGRNIGVLIDNPKSPNGYGVRSVKIMRDVLELPVKSSA